MRQNWWKFLGISILIYTVVVGLSTPLKPGVLQIDPLSIGLNGNDSLIIKHGETHKFRVKAYNTNFVDNQNSAWLKLDSIGAIKANKVNVVNDTEIDLTFVFPDHFPKRDEFESLTLVLHNVEDGTAILPDAVFVKSDFVNVNNNTAWEVNPISKLTDKPGMQFPYRSVLHETIRNTFFHIPLWFSMFIMLIVSLVYSLKYLRGGNLRDDIYASAMVKVAVLFGILGIITGSIWAKYTWGTFWTRDVKLNMSMIAMLIYVASLILRSSINDIDRRAKLSASYNIFAFAALIPLVFIIPRLTDSLHPGNGGNPALGGEDMENTLRMVFYPAIIGFTLLGLWMTSTLIRYEVLKDKWMTRK